MPKRGSEPTSRLGLSVSSSRVQPIQATGLKLNQIDPRMENLLASIHSRAAVQLNGTNGGIPLTHKIILEQTNGQSANKTATIV